MINDTTVTPVWRRSSRSTLGNDCVEMAVGASVVSLRDSKNASGPLLTVSRTSWSSFLAGVRSGEFDVPGSHPSMEQPDPSS
ncbi:MAG TPA: DUF397 domain-containing protein [Micromonosporaceae bacterium]|nr:DUF397 domain-containing protein [Micromonosporaceae bacterium]